jgi:hypothetical protein
MVEIKDTIDAPAGNFPPDTGGGPKGVTDVGGYINMAPEDEPGVDTKPAGEMSEGAEPPAAAEAAPKVKRKRRTKAEMAAEAADDPGVVITEAPPPVQERRLSRQTIAEQAAGRRTLENKFAPADE